MTEMLDRVANSPEVGSPRKRKEDKRLLTGRTAFVDNMTRPGLLHMAILRSPMAHAKIANIDLSAALELPGVVAAYSAKELGDSNAALPCVWAVTPDMKAPEHPALAKDTVRFVGDPVAVVIATSRDLAVDALDAIDVSYEPIAPVLDMEAALVEGSTLVHEAIETNKCYTWPFEPAPYDAAKAKADVVVKRRFINQRLIPAPMEPRSVMVDPNGPDGEVTVWSSTQIPHVLRVVLALTSGIPEHKLRVIAPDVGGGFGGKLQYNAEELLTVVLAARLGKSIKWTETRSENMSVMHHGRDQIQDIEICAKADGTLLGLKVDLIANMGAYLMLITPGIPLLGAFMYNSIYKFEGLSFTCHGVFTNTTPTDAYRGAGRPEATFAIERIMDELAAELGRDPMDLRRQNWIKHEEFPYTTVAGLEYDSGNYEAATDRAEELFDMTALRAEQAARRASGDKIQLGIGISTFTEMCGLAPSRVLASLNYAAGGWESATVRVLPTGKVEVATGSSPHGQGHDTAWSQIIADELGVPFEDVQVLHGDTRVSPHGMDTYGSRSLVVGGVALQEAARRVVEKAKLLAAHTLEANVDDIEFANGVFSVKGSPDANVAIQALAWAAFAAHNLPEGMEPTLQADSTLDPAQFSYPHGTHLCATEVDTETGEVAIRSYVCVDDIGNVVNPMIVEGQVHGGLAQGIAQALYEEGAYDEDGNFVTPSFAEYLIPSAMDLPHFVTDRTTTPATTNPLGVKGVGEAGCIASTPAVVNAIVDALRPIGVTDVRMPCTPERVWRAINEAKGANA
jgi:carbon-monoxide dehydrogenase large subunit